MDKRWLSKVLAENVSILAKNKGIPLAHLADQAGIGRTTMWRLLDVNDKGPSDPRLSTLSSLAEALGVEPADLLCAACAKSREAA